MPTARLRSLGSCIAFLNISSCQFFFPVVCIFHFNCDCQALSYFVWIKNGGIESLVLIMHNDPMDVSLGKSQLAKHFYSPDSCPSSPDPLIPTPGEYKRCCRCKAPVNLGAEIYLKADFPGLYEVFTSQVRFDRRYMIRVTGWKSKSGFGWIRYYGCRWTKMKEIMPWTCPRCFESSITNAKKYKRTE